MAAKAPKGTVLHLRADGAGAAEAVGALMALVERDFDEDGAHVRYRLSSKASPPLAGYAEGPVFDLDRPLARYAAKDSPEAERRRWPKPSLPPRNGWPA